MYHKLYSRLRVLAWTGVLFALFLASPTYGQTSSNNCGSCDDQNECTYDFCFLGRCINVPIANCNRSSTQQGSCEDGDPCTINFRDSRTGECRSRPNPNCDEDATRECVLFPPKIRIVCDDNNTLFDESDDVFYFYITTRGEYTSTCYNISGAVNALCLPYGEEAGPFGPFPANGNALQLRVFDQEKPSGNIAVKVLAPKGCNEDHCTLRIEEISVSECVYNQLSRGNRAVANVKVTWINAKSNNQLDIYLGSERRRLTNVPRNGFTTVSFEIPGDGISREVRAGFSYPGTCEDRRRFTAPVCQDNCPDDPNKTEPGICGCGTPDTDTDGDGTPDCKDNCPTDPNKTEPGECGCGVADTDTDGDGTPDCKDNCPTDPNKTEPGACGCGVADTDTDGDGTPDCKDNCPTDPNKTEPGACGCGVAETDCAPPDSNCPGLTTNGCEPQVFAKFDDCNKVTVCSAKDLSNVVLDLGPAGFQNFDTDIKFENLTGKTLMFTSETPIRGVWIKSGCNMSDDCPGCGEYIANPNFPCDEEVIDNCPDDPNKTEPGECGCGVADTDTDGDGTPDCKDNCPNDPNKTEPGECGCGVADTDTDGDGTPDCKDNCPNDPNKTEPGECGCGVAETDTDGDGTPDCKDNCPTDPNKTEPGACGCGVADTDTDGDGTPDCKDNCPTDPNKTEPGECGCGVAETDCAPPVFNCPNLTARGCLPQVFAEFDGCNKVTVCSARDLSNVVLDLGAPGFQGFGTDIKYDDLTGKTLMFTSETPIRGVWIKSGCNSSNDCPGCGEYVANPNSCATDARQVANNWANIANSQSLQAAKAPTLYPNPATDMLFVNLADYAGQTATVQIFNTVGQVVFQTRIDELTADPVRLDIKMLPGNIYWLRVQVPNTNIPAQRFIVK